MTSALNCRSFGYPPNLRFSFDQVYSNSSPNQVQNSYSNGNGRKNDKDVDAKDIKRKDCYNHDSGEYRFGLLWPFRQGLSDLNQEDQSDDG